MSGGHTPGPWGFHAHLGNPEIREIEQEDGHVFKCADYSIAFGDKRIAEVLFYKGTRGFPSVDDYAEFTANSHLIAAAPDLLASLKELAEEVDFEIEQRQHSGNDEDWIDLKAKSDRAHAAIAKAEGRS